MVASRRFHLICRRLSAQARETGCRSVTWQKTYESMGSGNEFRMRCVPRLSNRTEGFDISIKLHQPVPRRTACIIKLHKDDNAHSRFVNYLGAPIASTYSINDLKKVSAWAAQATRGPNSVNPSVFPCFFPSHYRLPHHPGQTEPGYHLADRGRSVFNRNLALCNARALKKKARTALCARCPSDDSGGEAASGRASSALNRAFS